jgi:hypothetical protein
MNSEESLHALKPAADFHSFTAVGLNAIIGNCQFEIKRGGLDASGTNSFTLRMGQGYCYKYVKNGNPSVLPLPSAGA